MKINKTQRLQKWFEENPGLDNFSYGEFMHIGANQTIFRIALDALDVNQNTVVLDTACAVGGNARWLASLYQCRVYGNDIDDNALAAARDLAEIEGIADKCTFVKASSDQLPFESEMFDGVISTDIFDSNEVLRVLKPGGWFVVSTLVTDQKATFQDLANNWGFSYSDGQDITALAFAFHRAKEAEAQLLLKSELIDSKELVNIINEHVIPYSNGARHFLLKLFKP